MALMTCPDCGKSISTNSRACPNCGYEPKELSGSIVVRRKKQVLAGRVPMKVYVDGVLCEVLSPGSEAVVEGLDNGYHVLQIEHGVSSAEGRVKVPSGGLIAVTAYTHTWKGLSLDWD